MGQLNQQTENKLKVLPKQPGVYLFYDKEKNIIYVGKAKVLKNRVNSYFKPSTKLATDKQLMVKEINSLNHLVVDSEEEALVLEAILIKRYLPKYNIDLRDDKSKTYIELDKTSIKIVRQSAIKKRVQGKHFGPYRAAADAQQVIKTINRVFLQPFYGEFQLGLDLQKLKKKILEHEFGQLVKKIKLFLRQDYKKIIAELKAEMDILSEEQKYEQAAKYRDQVYSLEQIKNQSECKKKEKFFRKELDIVKALSKLKESLGLDKIPLRIECYDISNIQGQFAVGSMVVFTNGEIDSDQYRKFKIKTVFQSNDVAMMKEVLSRRFKNKWLKPDLIIVDGGKPQLNSALSVLNLLNKKIQLASLAKREEEIFLPGQKESIMLKRNSSEFFLVQRIRDEAHRFAVSFYRDRHSKQLTKTEK